MSNFLLVAMFLFFTIPGFLSGQIYLALVFIIYGAAFGFEEFLANYYTGDTVSQHICRLIKENPRKGYKLLGFMLTGWIFWLASFFTPPGPITIASLVFSFLFLAIPSVIDKEYFLTLASILFLLAVGFTNSLALQEAGKTIFDLMRVFAMDHPIKFAITILSMLSGWLCLLAHLGIKFEKK